MRPANPQYTDAYHRYHNRHQGPRTFAGQITALVMGTAALILVILSILSGH